MYGFEIYSKHTDESNKNIVFAYVIPSLLSPVAKTNGR